MLIEKLYVKRERGSHTTSAAITMPVVVLFTIACVQASLWYQASSAATSAAQRGARTAAAEDGTAAAGQAAARSFVNDVVPNPDSVRVNVTRSTTLASATVTIQPLSLIPGWKPNVTQTITAPVERISR